jgi:two-component system phosphate regulon sensor histidine kinase PhoR
MEGFKVFENLCCEKIIVKCDKDAFTEALINLIDNAIKYSSERKSIFISTYEADNYLCLSVKDEGIGIKKSELDKILAPYYRTDEEEVHKKTGVGLGLSIIKHIMNAHKGKIEIESEWGSGSNFRLYFPLNNNYERIDKLRVE